MTAWVIGSSSQYSQAVVKQFELAGHTVEQMGRANLQYGATPRAQLERRETPDFVFININAEDTAYHSTDKRACLLYTSPSPRDRTRSRMPSSA